jgi:hypothetical protein
VAAVVVATIAVWAVQAEAAEAVLEAIAVMPQSQTVLRTQAAVVVETTHPMLLLEVADLG